MQGKTSERTMLVEESANQSHSVEEQRPLERGFWLSTLPGLNHLGEASERSEHSLTEYQLAILTQENSAELCCGLSPSLGKEICFHEVLKEWVLGLERWLSSESACKSGA